MGSKISSENRLFLSKNRTFFHVKVQFLNIDGKIKTIEASGLLARVIQHENDHLNGILFIDRLSEEKKAEAIEKFEHKKALFSKKRIRLR